MTADLLSCWQNQLDRCDADKTAIRWLDSALRNTALSWRTIEQESNRCAALLQACGCQKGERVFIFLPGIPQMLYYFLGAIKCGAVGCFLFPNFGADMLRARMQSAQANYLVMERPQAKYQAVFDDLPSLKKVICLKAVPDGLTGNKVLIAAPQSEVFTPVKLSPDDPMYIVFSSGSTGLPKAAMYTHKVAPLIEPSLLGSMRIRPDDIYWNTAHPAWIAGLVYGLIAPLLSGIESIQYGGNYHPKRWMPILQEHHVTAWATAPTAYRAMMKESPEFYQSYDFSALRDMYSCGEPCGANLCQWVRNTFGTTLHDFWYQSETGLIRIGNPPGELIKAGRMGRALEDCQAFVMGADGKKAAVGEIGKLCLKRGWKSCFSTYYGRPDLYAEKFVDDYFITGDLAECDEDGYFRFVGRDDDVIKTSGHLIGPYEIESVLNAREEVLEVAVVAAPDELLYEKIVAFVVLRPGMTELDKVETNLRVAVNTGISAYAVPKDFHFIDALPKTLSGKIQRALLRARLSTKPSP